LDDAYFMKQALQEAEKAFAMGEVPIGAVVVKGDSVIARGHNLRETWKDPTAHAEIIAIREAAKVLGGWRLMGTTMYVTIEPCPMCAGALVNARVERLVYGAKDPKAGAVESIINIVQNEAFNHRMEVTAGILEEECAQIMRDFFRRLREKL
jgi:tRNA(adenine34) deaminase